MEDCSFLLVRQEASLWCPLENAACARGGDVFFVAVQKWRSAAGSVWFGLQVPRDEWAG
jgi:hypothetical protein